METKEQIKKTNSKIVEIESELSTFGSINSDQRLELFRLKNELNELIEQL
jgi:hypothetical protein